jgi:predicted metal-dependent hydrolase
VHEFCHFLVPNHSARFYQCVASVLPDWHARRDEIRKYEGIMT